MDKAEIELQKRVVVTVTETPQHDKVWIEFGASLKEIRLTLDQARELVVAIDKVIDKVEHFVL